MGSLILLNSSEIYIYKHFGGYDVNNYSCGFYIAQIPYTGVVYFIKIVSDSLS